MNCSIYNDPSFAFMKLENKVNGVKRVFLFFKNRKRPENGFEEKLRNLVLFLSPDSLPLRIVIETFKSQIVVYSTDIFVLGALITREANPTLVDMILSRIASNVDTYFKHFAARDMKDFAEKIQERIEQKIPFKVTAPITVSLILQNLEVGGKIKAIALSPEESALMKESIQEVLGVEIPSFCANRINIDVGER